MSEKYKKTCKYSKVTGYVLIYAFTLLVCVPIGITSS